MSDRIEESAKDNRVAVGCIALVEAYDAYVKLLVEELNDVVSLAAAHGWKSARYEEGCRLRKKIEELKASTDQDHRSLREAVKPTKENYGK